MQARFTTDEEAAERRYRPETVQKAAALAAKLQQERRETLSATEAEQLAEELGIEPELMRQALATVARSEAATQPVQATYPPPAYMAAQGQTTTRTARRVPPAAFIGLMFPIFFALIAFWLLIARSAVVQPPMPSPPIVMPMETMPTATLVTPPSPKPTLAPASRSTTSP